MMELQNKLSIAETLLQTEKAVSIKGHDGATEQTLYNRDHAPNGEGREY